MTWRTTTWIISSSTCPHTRRYPSNRRKSENKQKIKTWITVQNRRVYMFYIVPGLLCTIKLQCIPNAQDLKIKFDSSKLFDYSWYSSRDIFGFTEGKINTLHWIPPHKMRRNPMAMYSSCPPWSQKYDVMNIMNKASLKPYTVFGL